MIMYIVRCTLMTKQNNVKDDTVTNIKDTFN